MKSLHRGDLELKNFVYRIKHEKIADEVTHAYSLFHHSYRKQDYHRAKRKLDEFKKHASNLLNLMKEATFFNLSHFKAYQNGYHPDVTEKKFLNYVKTHQSRYLNRLIRVRHANYDPYYDWTLVTRRVGLYRDIIYGYKNKNKFYLPHSTKYIEKRLKKAKKYYPNKFYNNSKYISKMRRRLSVHLRNRVKEVNSTYSYVVYKDKDLYRKVTKMFRVFHPEDCAKMEQYIKFCYYLGLYALKHKQYGRIHRYEDQRR